MKVLVGRLDLETYKAAIKGLTQFGDRREGTARNRAALDWIEAQLRSYGCTNSERVKYVYDPPSQPSQPAAAAAPDSAIASGEVRRGVGGSRLRGMTMPVVPNSAANAQTDLALRARNAELAAPGPREELYCTKLGATRADEMYIVGAHMDGRGFGEAADDDGSGTALIMELARVFMSPDVITARSIRFALWNNEETGLQGSRAYVEQRAHCTVSKTLPRQGGIRNPDGLR